MLHHGVPSIHSSRWWYNSLRPPRCFLMINIRHHLGPFFPSQSLAPLPQKRTPSSRRLPNTNININTNFNFNFNIDDLGTKVRADAEGIFRPTKKLHQRCLPGRTAPQLRPTSPRRQTNHPGNRCQRRISRDRSQRWQQTADDKFLERWVVEEKLRAMG